MYRHEHKNGKKKQSLIEAVSCKFQEDTMKRVIQKYTTTPALHRLLKSSSSRNKKLGAVFERVNKQKTN
jgi:hypothetical protein